MTAPYDKLIDIDRLAVFLQELQGTIHDGITPTVTVTTITGGHNVAFSYGSGDSRNTDFDVMDGATGPQGADGDDYVLTATDKSDIATLVYGMLTNADNTSY